MHGRTRTPDRHSDLRRRARGGALGLGLLVLGFAAPAAAQDVAPKPDHVMWLNRRGQPTTTTGTVLTNGLEQVTIDSKGSTRTIEAPSVQRIVFGKVPASFRDGEAYLLRDDYANAAASFRLAASDAETRDVVQAAARLRAARAELRNGATDPTAFGRAREEAQRFLKDFPKNREVPDARMIAARAARLAGDAAGAAEAYRAIFAEAAGGKPAVGYPIPLCYAAGLGAAEAFMAANDTLQAKEIFGALEQALPQALSSFEAEDPERAELAAIQAEARLGEGRCLLVTGDVERAKAFFQGQLDGADERDAALQYGAMLGLAESLLAEGDARAAQLRFAEVSALDHTDRDRVARALVGLARCATELPDGDAREQARRWLQVVREQYGDTPAVLVAQELSRNL